MTRWRVALHVAVGTLVLLWWAPAIVLMAARLMLGRLRFKVLMGLGRALVAVGCPGAASKVYAREIRRAERGTRAIERWP